MAASDAGALLHQRVRLQIMAVLYRHRDVAFAPLRDLLKLTDGNLAAHTTKLSAAGFLQTRRALTRNGFETRYRITVAGSEAFRAYLHELRRFLETVDSKETAPPASGNREPGPARA